MVSRSGRREGGREGVGTRARRCRGGSASSDPPSSLSRADATEHLAAYNNVIQVATSWRRNILFQLIGPNRNVYRFPLGRCISLAFTTIAIW